MKHEPTRLEALRQLLALADAPPSAWWKKAAAVCRLCERVGLTRRTA